MGNLARFHGGGAKFKRQSLWFFMPKLSGALDSTSSVTRKGCRIGSKRRYILTVVRVDLGGGDLLGAAPPVVCPEAEGDGWAAPSLGVRHAVGGRQHPLVVDDGGAAGPGLGAVRAGHPGQPGVLAVGGVAAVDDAPGGGGALAAVGVGGGGGRWGGGGRRRRGRDGGRRGGGGGAWGGGAAVALDAVKYNLVRKLLKFFS